MANDTTPTGVPIIECAECGRRHPVTRSHCPVCGKASLFGLAAQFDRWLAAHDAEVRAPLEAEVERLRAKVGEQAEYLAYHLRDFRPRALEAHIADNGITQGVCLGTDGRIWDGHHRIVAARRLGIPEIPLEDS